MAVFNRPPPPPVPLRQMSRHYYDGFNTLCQYLRDIWHLMNEQELDKEDIRMKLRVAMAMAKSMDKAIRERTIAEMSTEFRKNNTLRIEVITMMYNEEFLAHYFCRHYAWADRIRVLLDTDTSDNTESILSEYENVVIEPFTFPDMMDDIIKVEKLNACYLESYADWVILVDADEFIFTRNHETESIREYLEAYSGFPIMQAVLYNVYRNRKDSDLVLEKGYLNRRHGDINVKKGINKYYIKPIVVRSGHFFQWTAGMHSIQGMNFKRVGPHYFIGAHWAMADPCFCVERRVRGRRDRQSEVNLKSGLTKHNHYITEESVLEECEAHLDDPKVF